MGTLEASPISWNFIGFWVCFRVISLMGFRVILWDLMEVFDVFFVASPVDTPLDYPKRGWPKWKTQICLSHFFVVMVRSPYPLDGNKKTIARQKTLLPVEFFFQCLCLFFAGCFTPTSMSLKNPENCFFFSDNISYLWQSIILLPAHFGGVPI